MNTPDVIKRCQELIDEASVRLGIYKADLVLTGGTIPRLLHDLPMSDVDLVSISGAKACLSPFAGYHESDKALTSGPFQLLKAWKGRPPYSFDFLHVQGYVTHDGSYSIPVEAQSKTIKFGPLIDPVGTLGRLVKWTFLGFRPEHMSDLEPLVYAIKKQKKVDRRALSRNSGDWLC